jgi:hypothetical protein
VWSEASMRGGEGWNEAVAGGEPLGVSPDRSYKGDQA